MCSLYNNKFLNISNFLVTWKYSIFNYTKLQSTWLNQMVCHSHSIWVCNSHKLSLHDMKCSNCCTYFLGIVPWYLFKEFYLLGFWQISMRRKDNFYHSHIQQDSYWEEKPFYLWDGASQYKRRFFWSYCCFGWWDERRRWPSGSSCWKPNPFREVSYHLMWSRLEGF